MRKLYLAWTILASLAIILMAMRIVTLGRIVRDQRIYMDNGCRGRYQGEGDGY